MVLGVGNLYRCDDAAGIMVARNLIDKGSDYMTVQEQSGEGTNLIEAWKKFDKVWIVDAVSSGGSHGIIHRFDVLKNSIPSDYFSCSSHNFGVAEAIELARTLNKLPAQLQLYGIEGKNFQHGEMISQEVKQAITTVADEIYQSISLIS